MNLPEPRPAMPRWVKVFLGVAAVVALLAVGHLAVMHALGLHMHHD